MSTEITINQDIVEINVTEEVVVIEAPSGAYPLPTGVYSVFGRTGNVVAQEGDYTLTQLGDVTISTPSNGQVLRYNGTTWVNATESFAGTVTSVNMSVPTGLTISGNPITTSGTLAVGLGAGYVIPTQAALDAKQDDLNGTGIVKSTAGTITYLSDNTANWNTAYNDSIVSASVTGTATKTLTLNQQDGGSVTASWTDTDTGLTSVGLSMPSAFSVANSPLTANGTLSVTGAGTTAQYVRGDGSLATFPSLTGFVPYTGATGNVNLGTHSLSAYDLIINHTSGSGVAASITKGGSGEALTVIKTSGSGNAASITGGVTLLDELHLTTDLADAYIASAATWNAKQNAITLTTTGTSGAATLVGATLNIPQYQGVLTNPVTGTGTTNTLPKFTGASTIGNSNITDTGSLITLGSNSFINGLFGIGSTPVGSSSNFYLTNNITGGTAWNSVYLLTNVLSDVTSQARGFVSNIGTQAATFTLSNLTHYRSEQGTFRAGSTVTTQVGYLASGSLVGATNNYAFQGSIPSGTNRWNLYMDGTAANYLAGQLLIGTTTTSAFALDVNGTARTSGELTVNTVNIGLGGGAISNNTRVGLNALNGNTTGSNNVAFGQNALQFNTTGGLNTAIGTNAGINNSTGSSNTLVGVSSLQNNLTGSLNVAIGRNSGRFIADGTTTLTTANNSMFIGFDTRANADNQTNQIVIGYQAIGLGSNTTVIGNSSTTATTIFGALTANSFIPTSSTIPTNGMYLSGTNTLGFATNGTLDMVLDANGALGIGTTALTSSILRIGRNITGSSSFNAVDVFSTVQSDVVTSYSYRSIPATQAATFSTDLIGFFASQGTIGAGSTITSHTGVFINNLNAGSVYGVRVLSSNIGSSTAQAFRGDLAAGTNVWNLFMNGTANNYLAGSLGIGSTSLSLFGLRISKTITGGTIAYNQFNDGSVQSDVTSEAMYYSTNATTAAAAFTLTNLFHYRARYNVFGAGSAVTNQYGFFVDSTLTAATNNYGFWSAIPSGTNRWNLYMAGTADNYMAGKLGIGTTNIGSSYIAAINGGNGTTTGPLLVFQNSATGTGNDNGFIIGNYPLDAYVYNYENAPIIFGTNNVERVRIKAQGQMRFVPLASDPSGAQAGDVYYNSTTNKLKVYNGTTWETITSL